MEHTLERHISFVNELCRCCGKANITIKQKSRFKKPDLCVNHEANIFMIFDIDTKTDQVDKHSKYICQTCLCRLRYLTKGAGSTAISTARDKSKQSNNIWCCFDETVNTYDCRVCQHRLNQKKGCIGKRRPRTFQDAADEINKADLDNAMADDMLSDMDEFERLMPEIIAFENDNIQLDRLSQLSKTSTMVEASTSPIKFTPKSTPVKDQAGVAVESSTSPMFKDYETLKTTITKPVNEPLSQEEERLTTKLVKRKLHIDPEKSSIKCKTGGQSIHLRKIVKPRKSTSKSKSDTKEKRTKHLEQLRQSIAGPSTADIDMQLASEYKRLPRKRRLDVADTAGIKEKIMIGTSQSLAIKEELGLSWQQEKKHRRMMKEFGVKIAGENLTRGEAKRLMSGFIMVKSLPFETDEGIDQDVVFGYVSDLISLVDRLLNGYKEQNMLTWHDDNIPSQEIWIKLGGDHGKHSMKMTLQIANTTTPNAKRNTAVIGIAPVRDTYVNIDKFFDYTKLREQLDCLMQHTWEEKSIRVFINGDYEFLTKIYGLSGAAGKFPCLWCLIPRHHMNSNNPPTPNYRSLESLADDYGTFLDRYKENKKDASRCNNSIHSPLLKVSLHNIVPPYLHILLGIVKKHHDLLVAAAHNIDKLIMGAPKTYLTEFGILLKEYGGQWRKKVKFEEKYEHLRACIILSDSKEDKEKFTKTASQTEQMLSDMSRQNLEFRSGPVASSLDDVLMKNRIVPQSYHSRAFIGNHCHKYLNEQVYEQLTSEIIRQTQTLTRCPDIIDKTYLIRNDFNDLNKALSRVHSSISHTKPVKIDEINDIQESINYYMNIYRQLFPNKTIPKQHLLEKHCMPFIRTTKLGLGLLGEQGTEMSHQAISKLEKRASGIKSEKGRMKFILETHLLHVAPVLRTAITQKKKHKTKD